MNIGLILFLFGVWAIFGLIFALTFQGVFVEKPIKNKKIYFHIFLCGPAFWTILLMPLIQEKYTNWVNGDKD